MSAELVLSIDQGTSNTKTLVTDGAGQVVARASVPLKRRYPQPGWVEQDARELWESVVGCLSQLDRGLLEGIAAIGIANQRESVLLWERRSGEPVGPCVSWQCQRGASLCQELSAAGYEPAVRAATGLPLDAAFSASKAAWLLHAEPSTRARAERGELCLGTIDSWLLWNLTGGAVHATEPSNASRTLLFDIHALDWDADLLSMFGIPGEALAAIAPSGGLHAEARSVGHLPAGVPVYAMLGDSHAALYGHSRGRSGVAKASYGTGTSVMTLSPTPPGYVEALLATIAWMTNAVTYALEGNILSTGATVQWAADLLGLAGGAEEVARRAASTDGLPGVYLVPAFVGLGAPHFDASARGLLTGLTLGSDASAVARAAVESIAYQVRDVVEALDQQLPVAIDSIWADGGATTNDWLMQFQADILGRPVHRSATAEVAAAGVAYMAGQAAGIWDSIEHLPSSFDRFEPQMADGQRDELYAGWLDAVAQARRTPRLSAEVVS